MKRKLKKLTALLLSILLVTSSFTELLPARAAEEGVSAPEVTAQPPNLDFSNPVTGRPGLFVDFLGDNKDFRAVKSEAPNPGGVLTPGDEDQSAKTNPNATNTWGGYTAANTTTDTIFWVGVGIDRMNVLDLFKQDNNGVYSLELGFYYNETYIEPYTGTDYKATLTAANIDNYTHKWGNEYEIITAETGLTPQTDAVTQETLKKPGMGEITAPGSTWKMTYIALEKKPDLATKNRFSDLYTGKFHPLDKDDTLKNEDTKYLLLIPFKLNAHDTTEGLCLRMARNASHFSIGGGSEGVTPYGAWERVTVRNENRELKLMTNFMGDLNIFTGEKSPDDPYKADLKIKTGGGLGNTATLGITNDPSPNPVKAVKDGDSIAGLYSGTGMTLNVKCATGYDVTVTVTLEDGTTAHPFITHKAKEHYSFIMPEGSVIVTVNFQPNNDTEFWAYLNEDHSKEVPTDTTVTTPAITGNNTTIAATGILIDKDTSADTPGNLPGKKVTFDTEITITTALHPDYYAVVGLQSVSNGTNIPPLTRDPADLAVDATTKVVTIPAGGKLTLKMPKSDVEVTVQYLPATRNKATLEVYHDIAAGDSVPTQNVAQLTAPVYRDDTTDMPAYSGVVYHKRDILASPITNDHSALEGGFRVLPKVDASTAEKSKGLGGDGGKTAVVWNSSASAFMALAYTATKADDFKGKLAPFDLKAVSLSGKVAGLRKNAVGESYTDSDIKDFFARLFEVATLAKAEGATYKKDVLDVGGADPTKVLYTYYDLTPEQVQVYLLDYEKYATDTANGVTPAPTKPALRTAADALTALAAYTWFVPSSTTIPPTAPDPAATPPTGTYLEVRAGRQVELVLEADSAYTVQSIVLHDPRSESDPSKAEPDVAVPLTVTDYQNVFPFTMPDYECAVRVTYALRKTFNLKLKITDEGSQVDNKVSLTAYTPMDNPPGGTAAKAVTLTANGDIPNTLGGSVVTVKVNKRSGYIVSAAVKQSSNSTPIVTTPTSTTDMKDGTVFTFIMPEGNAEVGISYTKENVPANKATIVLVDEDGASLAVWDGTTQMILPSVSQGTSLRAEGTIAPGYYVHSVEVYTATRSYPYSTSGNGWNNGLGGKITVDTVMPGADLFVKLTVRKGPPPVEAELPLTIMVSDPDNVGAGSPPVFADNWAKVSYTRGGAPVDLGPVGKGVTGGAVLSAMEYATAGDEVIVEFHPYVVSNDPTKSYYVKNVEILPASLGVTVEWLTTTTARFTMPSGSATVAVSFAKGSTPTWFMDLARTETAPGAGGDKNTVTSFTSDTITPLLPSGYPVPQPLPRRVPLSQLGVGAAKAGEKVVLNLTVAQGWYVHSLTVTAGGARLPYNLPNQGYNAGADSTVEADFVMPNSHVSVTVNYRQGPIPTVPDYQMELAVTDPDNVTDGTAGWTKADNYASADITGGTTSTIGAVGMAKSAMRGVTYAKPGDTVTIDYTAAAGFAMDIIIVTPSGLRIIPTYLGGNKASFTMPDASVTAEVRFKKGTANQYSADLILRAEDGTALTKGGRGSFGTNYAADKYSVAAAVGTKLDLALLAQDGYYIKEIIITPVALGVSASLSGSFGQQSGSFVMPAANVTVNVYFGELWPDKVKYDLTLMVYDGDQSGSSANFGKIGGTVLGAPDSDKVFGGGKKTLKNAALDRESVFVAIDAVANYYPSSITVTDSRGVPVAWEYAVEGAQGGIRFTMPPSRVTVTVRFAEGTAASHDARFHIKMEPGSTGNASLEQMGGVTLTADGTISGVPAGNTMRVTSTPITGKVVSVLAVSASGKQLLVPMEQVTEGGTSAFAMPAEAADVYVVFDNRVAPGADDKLSTLVVSGPTVASGSAEMKAAAPLTAATGKVDAGSSGLMFAPKDTVVTVDITTAANMNLSSVSVVDGLGNAVPYTWTDATQRHFTYKMPVTGAAVYVALEDISATRTDLTAQVVVNDSEYTSTVVTSRNTALLRKDTAAKPGTGMLTALKAGDKVYLDMTVQPGFEIKEIIVVPCKYGIAPSLTLKPKQDQDTSFIMPADDVVVYVRFGKDGLTRHKVTLSVSGTPGNTDNKGFIHSAFSGKKGPVVSGKSQTVEAAYSKLPEDVEWITVDYDWDANSSVQSLTVKDSLGRDVPFTQVNTKQIRFPMVDSKIDVKLQFQNTPTPPTFDAVLHVIDLDTAGDTSWAKLTWNGTDTGNVSALPNPGGTATLPVPAGETVTLDALADTDVYIKAAYVLFEDGGQMIECNLTPDDPGPGYTGAKNADFKMHPGKNHVYVYFTKTPPTVTEYAAVLMLDGPATDTGSTKSKAVMTHSGGASSATVLVNAAHGYVTAEKDETITVTVLPNVGYTIDYILMTPLGIPIVPKRTGNTFTFTMPAQNVAARVVLKESSAAEYKVTLHYRMQDGTAVANSDSDWASLTYTGEDGNPISWKVDGEARVVPEGETVTLGVSMDAPRYILSAYALKGSTAVPLSKVLEGVTEGKSLLDDERTDETADFTMPGGNVDVYVWFAPDVAVPPFPDDPGGGITPGAWRSAVLVVTDEDAHGNLNKGGNYASIESSINNTTAVSVATSSGNMGHAYLVVKDGETVTVTVGPPAPGGYEFQRPATVTHSLAGATLGLTESGSAPNYSYRYNVGAFDSVVAVHYKSAAVSQNGLTVVAVDNDNPGNRTVTNNVTVTPAAMVPLSLDSTTSAGARQIIPGISENTQINFKVTPHSGYYPIATLVSGSGATATSKNLALTLQPDGSYAGTAFPMPGKSATLTVMFYKSLNATLKLVNTASMAAGDQSSQAKMTENSFNGSTTADFVTQGVLSNLPGGTELAASMINQAGTLLGAVLLERGSATLMSPTPVSGKPDEYRHTLSNVDATIQMVITNENHTDGYIAAVTSKKLPEGCDAPTITTTPPNSVAGAGWTVAKTGETVTVHVTVPTNYRADLVNSDGTVLTPASLNTSGDATFTMPDKNVQVTVTYTKTAFDAKLLVVDDGDFSSATLTSGGTTVNAGVPLPNLAAGSTVRYDTTLSNMNKELVGALVTTAGGDAWFINPEALVADVTMPADDITITIMAMAKPADPTKPKDKGYIASVKTDGQTDDLPGNVAKSIQNITTEALPAGHLWAGGYAKDLMLVAFTAEPGYTAVVTAKTPGGATVPVLQQDITGSCTAYVTMPADDVLVTITYYKGEPTLIEHDLTLKLVGHGKEADNKAVLAGNGITPISLAGSDAANADTPAIKTVPTAAKLGVNLDLSADRKSDYTIVKATLEVNGVETELALNRYGTNATSLFFMPDADATVTVYYSKIYISTLQIVGAEGKDKSSMSTTGYDPIITTGGKLDKLLGGETINATATADTGRKVVGVLYSSPNTGAHSISGTNKFIMPKEDVIVTTIFQGEDEKNHIAKVTLAPDSAPGGGTIGIKNKADPTASAGPFWTLAKKDDGVTVTIGLTAGYQAVITSAVRDDTNGDIYISRKSFTASTVDKTATFTMPDADATVTVKFIKGYTAQLVITDVSKQGKASNATIGDNTAAPTTIIGTSDGANPDATITYTDDKIPANATNKIVELGNGVQVDYTVTTDPTVTAKVVKTTAATGTAPLTAPGNFPIAGEDVTVGVILRDANDPNKLLAKVELLGESDIVGNEVGGISDATSAPPITATGNIWTTTKEENTITVSLTVAKGYVVEVTATRDDVDRTPIKDLSKDGGTTEGALVGLGFAKGTGPLGDYISDSQTVTFTMPKDSTDDVTVYVKYIYAGTIPAPNDPERLAKDKLKDGYIYGENRGDFAVITIPTLMDASDKLYDADQYEKTPNDNPATKVTFHFFIHDKVSNTYTELRLDGETADAVIAPYDPDNLADEGDPYNYGNYYTKPAAGTDNAVHYIGAKFTLTPKGESNQAKALAAILDNNGSLNADKETTLYVMAENARGEKSAYTQVLVNPYFQLKGTFQSYAPTHKATASLYAIKDGLDPTANLTDPGNYEATVFAMDEVAEPAGDGLWRQEFAIKSSELAGGTYMLVLEKTSHITYTRVNIELDTTLVAPEYDAGTKTFSIMDEIILITGDTVASGRINLGDRDLVMDYLVGSGTGSWSRETDKTKPDWATSIFNPETEVYRCDLNGDGHISVIDRDLVMDNMSWSDEDYLVGGKLPSGLSQVVTLELNDLELTEPPILDPEEPVDPDMTVDPEPPTDPEQPLDPDMTVDPEPEVPAEPDKPIDPATPVDPAPIVPVAPPKPEDPKDPTAEPPKEPEAGEGPPPTPEGESDQEAPADPPETQ